MHYKNLKNLKLLIVEDEKNLAKLLKDAIGEYFFSVILAKDGEEGFFKLKKNKPDIVITDIMMPNCDGLEMTKKIKAYDEDMFIIILSAFSQKEKLLKAIDLGINKYFIKPFDPEELLEYINSITHKIDKKKKFVLEDNYIYDNNKKSLYKDDVLVKITKKENEFLYLLLKNQNEVVKNKEIKEFLWEKELVSEERLRTFIKRLRFKTSKNLIKNAAGLGYLISPL